MSEIQCPHCGRKLSTESGAAFCPYCGGALSQPQAAPEDSAVRELLAKVETLTDPVKKYALLHSAQAQYPKSLAIAEELLFLGRLHERNPKVLDFSVIKCYLLMIYLEPETMMPEKIGALRRELFDCPELDACLALCEDQTAFLNKYLTRLSGQFIDLFLHGSSKYMHRFFGLGLDSRAPKLLAAPVAHMLAAMRDDPVLSAEQRSLLMHALYAAYNARFMSDMQWLQKEMTERNVTLD